jgi:hypothetical protein
MSSCQSTVGLVVSKISENIFFNNSQFFSGLTTVHAVDSLLKSF